MQSKIFLQAQGSLVISWNNLFWHAHSLDTKEVGFFCRANGFLVTKLRVPGEKVLDNIPQRQIIKKARLQERATALAHKNAE